MIYYYRGLVIVFSAILILAGSFLIYDSFTNPLHTEGLSVIPGACCCALALILIANLLVRPGEPVEPEQTEQEIKLRELREKRERQRENPAHL